MRFVPAIIALLLSGAAVAQTPVIKDENGFIGVAELLTLEQVEKMPPSVLLRVVMDGVPPGMMPAKDVLQMIRQGKRVWRLNTDSTPSCKVDYSEVSAEKRVSDDRLRAMERRGDVIPLQHQYEQEMYYEDRRNRIYEKACGKPPQNYIADRPDMRKKACEVLGVVCKPVKHW